MKRRALLATMGSGAIGVAGCTSFGPPELALGRVLVSNYTPADVEVAVEVTRDAEAVYDETIAIDGEAGEITGDVIIGEWLGEVAEYELSVDVVGEEFTASATTTEAVQYFDERWSRSLDDGTCFEFDVLLGSRLSGEFDGVRIEQGIIPTGTATGDFADSCPEYPG